MNDGYGINFTEMDKVLLQLEKDFTNKDKWKVCYPKLDEYAICLVRKEPCFVRNPQGRGNKTGIRIGSGQ